MEHFSHVKLYLIFSFFLLKKKKSGDSTHHLPKKIGILNKHPNPFFEGSFVVYHTLHILDMGLPLPQIPKN